MSWALREGVRLDERLVAAIDAINATFVAKAGHTEKWPHVLGALGSNVSDHYNKGHYLTADEQSCLPYVYLAGWMPRYLPRLRIALRCSGLSLEALLSACGDSVRLLDVGCGPGTFTVAALNELQRACASRGERRRIEVLGRDHNRTMLEAAEQLITMLNRQGYWPNLDLTWDGKQQELLAGVPSPRTYDLVIFGHSVCELYQRKRIVNWNSLLESMSQLLERTLANRGVAIILEPCLPRFLDTALRFHDFFRSGVRKFHILGPCLGDGQRCPEWSQFPQWANGKGPSCASVSPKIDWLPTYAGRKLKTFLFEAEILKTPKSCRISHPPGFWALVLARHPRPKRVPSGTGIVVHRPDSAGVVVCVVQDNGDESLVQIQSSLVKATYEPVSLQNPTLPRVDVSALYPNGWPGP